MQIRFVFIMLVLLMGAAALTGCQTQGSGQSDNGTEKEAPKDEEGAGQTVNIDLSEFSIEPANVTVKTGEKVTFNVENNGSTLHTYSIAGIGESRLNAGEQEKLEVNFDEPGTYEVRCTVPGHADRGMTGEITVE